MEQQFSMLPSTARLWDREQWLTVIRIATEVQNLRFARQVAMAWLNVYPGDLMMSYWLAKSFVLDGLIGQGQVILERALQVDPSFTRDTNYSWISLSEGVLTWTPKP